MNKKSKDLLDQIGVILEQTGGEKYIPLGHEYWGLKNQFRAAEQEPEDNQNTMFIEDEDKKLNPSESELDTSFLKQD